MPLGKPAIPTPRALELRNIAQAVDATRERFSNIETDILALQKLVGASKDFQAIKQLQQQLKALAQQIAALDTSASIAVVNALLMQPNGLVVLKDGELVTRVLQAGEGIVILYPDGSVSDPLIKTTIAPVDALPLANAGDSGWAWVDDALDEVTG